MRAGNKEPARPDDDARGGEPRGARSPQDEGHGEGYIEETEKEAEVLVVAKDDSQPECPQRVQDKRHRVDSRKKAHLYVEDRWAEECEYPKHQKAVSSFLVLSEAWDACCRGDTHWYSRCTIG